MTPCARCSRFACPSLFVNAAWAFKSCADAVCKDRERIREWFREAVAEKYKAQAEVKDLLARIEQDAKK